VNIKLLTLTCQNFIVYELCVLQWDSVVTTFMRARAEVLEDYFRVKSYNESGRYNVFRDIKSAYLSSCICSQLKYTSLPRCLHIYSVHSLTVSSPRCRNGGKNGATPISAAMTCYPYISRPFTRCIDLLSLKNRGANGWSPSRRL
jgi:hypothetical protein